MIVRLNVCRRACPSCAIRADVGGARSERIARRARSRACRCVRSVCDEIRLGRALGYVDDLVATMDEIWRVSKAGASSMPACRMHRRRGQPAAIPRSGEPYTLETFQLLLAGPPQRLEPRGTFEIERARLHLKGSSAGCGGALASAVEASRTSSRGMQYRWERWLARSSEGSRSFRLSLAPSKPRPSPEPRVRPRLLDRRLRASVLIATASILIARMEEALLEEARSARPQPSTSRAASARSRAPGTNRAWQAPADWIHPARCSASASCWSRPAGDSSSAASPKSLPFRDRGAVDSIVCEGALDHFVDPARFIEEASRVLRQAAGWWWRSRITRASRAASVARRVTLIADVQASGPTGSDPPTIITRESSLRPRAGGARDFNSSGSTAFRCSGCCLAGASCSTVCRHAARARDLSRTRSIAVRLPVLSDVLDRRLAEGTGDESRNRESLRSGRSCVTRTRRTTSTRSCPTRHAVRPSRRWKAIGERTGLLFLRMPLVPGAALSPANRAAQEQRTAAPLRVRACRASRCGASPSGGPVQIEQRV